MSVAEALKSHAVHEFRQHVNNLLKDRGMNVTNFLNRVYGRQAISNFYPVLNGTTRLTEENAKRWAAVLEVTEESLLKAYDPLGKIVAEERVRRRGQPREKISPNYKDLRRAVLDRLKERRMTMTNLATALGNKTVAPVSAILAGRTSLTPDMADRMGEALEVSGDSLLELSQKRATPIKKKRSGGATIYPVSGVEIEEDLVADELAPLEGGASSSERFSLVVNGDGTAEVRLHLMKVPLERALKLVASLELRELLSQDYRLRLTHDGDEKRSA